MPINKDMKALFIDQQCPKHADFSPSAIQDSSRKTPEKDEGVVWEAESTAGSLMFSIL